MLPSNKPIFRQRMFQCNIANPSSETVKFCQDKLAWLVVYLPLWKIWKSVGITIPNIWKNKNMFQTTNQSSYLVVFQPFERSTRKWHTHPLIVYRPLLCSHNLIQLERARKTYDFPFTVGLPSGSNRSKPSFRAKNSMKLIRSVAYP